jgi:hypothetical protein
LIGRNGRISDRSTEQRDRQKDRLAAALGNAAMGNHAAGWLCPAAARSLRLVELQTRVSARWAFRLSGISA